MKIFCERLKELRLEKKLTISQLAKEIGVSDAAISRWENNERIPNIDNLFAIANFFHVSSDFLIGLENL